jgi:AraC-like DNA-binding protein
VVALEDRRMVHGGLLGGEVRVAAAGEEGDVDLAEHLAAHGMEPGRVGRYLARLTTWPETRVHEAARFLHDTFYQVSGWKPDLMRENRLHALQQEQISQAIEDQRRSGKGALYAFEKERMLLACIRAGDRNGARKILNEMLATIYMSSPQLVVLRARTVEMMSCLTRAAIEDNPLLEPLIERNHAWTERLVRAGSFEDLSHELMGALDEFIDGIYLHGMNRSNTSVRRALDLISRDYAKRIGLSAVAREVGLSPGRLARLVKEFTGRTVLQVIHEVRVGHAQQMLERTSKSCAEVAYEVGFGDQSYFIRQFRRLTGQTPARYRRFLHPPQGASSPSEES